MLNLILSAAYLEDAPKFKPRYRSETDRRKRSLCGCCRWHLVLAFPSLPRVPSHIVIELTCTPTLVFRTSKNWQNSLAAATILWVGTSRADAKIMSLPLRPLPRHLHGPRPSSSALVPGDGVSSPSSITIPNSGSSPSAKPKLKLLVIAVITNMMLNVSKWDGIAGAMTMRTWVDALGNAHPRTNPSSV